MFADPALNAAIIGSICALAVKVIDYLIFRAKSAREWRMELRAENDRLKAERDLEIQRRQEADIDRERERNRRKRAEKNRDEVERQLRTLTLGRDEDEPSQGN